MSKEQRRRRPRIKFDERNGTITGGTITNLRSLFSLNVVRTIDKLINDILVAFTRNELRGLAFLTTTMYRQDENTQILRGYFRITDPAMETSRVFLKESTFDIMITKDRRTDVQIDQIEEYDFKSGIPFLTSKQPNAVQLPKIRWFDYTGPVNVISRLVQQETPWRLPDMYVMYNGPDMPQLEVGVLIAPYENFHYPQELNVRYIGNSTRIYEKGIGKVTSIYNKENQLIVSENIRFRVRNPINGDVDITGRTTTADRIRSRRETQDSDSTLDIAMDTITISEDQ